LKFQHTAARRRLEPLPARPRQPRQFQHTAARRRLGQTVRNSHLTHGFNTQPPEGGWACGIAAAVDFMRFNTQPPEGGWIGAKNERESN